MCTPDGLCVDNVNVAIMAEEEAHALLVPVKHYYDKEM